MSARVRIIRFGRAEAVRSVVPGEEFASPVFLQGQPAAAGRIVRRGDTWVYLLADDTPTGLASTDSRAALEEQVIAYHFGPGAS
ncbi:MAG: hypothetical protein JSS11_10805 [Verrucomicrobia bacterium]|nr:hypothetical protein [Verrucomicrobiota bacterium]